MANARDNREFYVGSVFLSLLFALVCALCAQLGVGSGGVSNPVTRAVRLLTNTPEPTPQPRRKEPIWYVGSVAFVLVAGRCAYCAIWGDGDHE